MFIDIVIYHQISFMTVVVVQYQMKWHCMCGSGSKIRLLSHDMKY